MRQLCHAAAARRKEEWDRTAFLCSWIELKISGKWVNPDKLNPYRRPKQQPKRPVSEAENKIAWQVLGNAMRSMRRK